MGFNKIAARAATKESKQARSGDNFKPTTDKELRNICKRAAAREEERSRSKSEQKQGARNTKGTPYPWKTPKDTLAIKNALLSNQKIKVCRTPLFQHFVEVCKEREQEPPAYREYEPRKKADALFLYDIQVCCAKLPWQRLSELLAVGAGKPIPTRDWAEAFHCVLWLMKSAFGVRSNFLSKKGDHILDRIEDTDALEEWPVTARKRRRNNDDEELDMTLERRNASMRASAEDDEDDEDEEETNKRVADDEDEDDEDERPARKKSSAKKAAKKKPAKKSSRRDADADEDDEDEDEKPARRKRASKDDDDDEDEDEKPARKAGAVKLEPNTVLKKGAKKRAKSGAKQKLYEMVTVKGVKLKVLLAECGEEGIPVSKAKKWLPSMVKKGYIAIA